MPSPRAFLFRLHWALGLTAGLVLAVMGATGALLSYEEALTGWANADRAVVAARGEPLALSALAARIEARLPGQRVATFILRDDPAASTTVRFTRDPVTRQRPAPVLADPYDGAVLGEVRWAKAFATIRALHQWMLLPDDGNGWGRQVTGISTVALLIFLATGLVLRWPQVHRLGIWLRPSLSRPGRARWWSLHAVGGTWLLPVYVVIALSGLTWSYDGFKDVAHRVLIGPAGEAKPKRMAGPRTGGVPAVDAAWESFRAGEGREAGLSQLLIPEDGRQPIRIRWFAHGAEGTAARNEARYEAATGTLVSAERFADQAIGKKIASNMLEVHRGRFFGDGIALVFFLAALAMPGFAATGLVLYVLRRRAAGRRRRRAALPVAAE
jgi:sulfite reductase (NADPH) flavoprotein alpha-component